MADDSVFPTDLTVDDRTTPLNLPPETRPGFSWSVPDSKWGREQTAYRILVARSEEALEDRDLLWDSGRVDSADSTGIEYGGPPLAADTRYCWTVRVWNDLGDSTAFAAPSTFATAPEAAWPGEWIAYRPDPGDTNGYRSRWRKPGGGEAWVQADLGERRDFDQVVLHPAEPFDGPTTPDGRTVTANDTEEGYREATTARGPVAFGFPDRYRIDVADDPDFANARTVVDRTDENQPDPRREPVVLEPEATGRYVRVVATALDRFEPDERDVSRLREERRTWAVFALAELSVRNGGEAIARGCPVTASSSVESDTWGTAHLTNGAKTSAVSIDSSLLRREFELSKPVARARLHVSGVGYGELYVNGEKAHDSVLDPGWTDYDRRVLYTTHDVSDLLREGANAMGLWLGRGWFSKPTRGWTAFGTPRARLYLTVEYADGMTRELTTGGDWQAASGPITENDIYDGEVYDARREREGWTEPGVDETEWEPADVIEAPPGDLYPQQTPPIRVVETLDPERIIGHEAGPIVDFGQNHTGWLELDVEGAAAGREIELRHAEALTDEGDLQTVDLRTADATDTYVAAGGEETYEPRFTYHGYRYAQVSGYPGDLEADAVRSKVVHTDLDSRGSFACSNEDLNRVQENARWGLRSNAHSVPTDCPQRDERQGFTGDGHLAAGALLYNFDAAAFEGKFLRDHADAQSAHGYLPSTMPNGETPAMTDPTWTYSWLLIPWRLYQHYGTPRALRDHYEGLCRYIDFWLSVAEAGHIPEEYSIYGDWVDLEHPDSPFGEPTEIFTDAYHYRGTALLAEIAETLGCEDDAERYRARAEAIGEAFNERYFNPERGIYEPFTQASNAVPLAFGLPPAGREDEVAAALVEKVREEDDAALRTGFLGTPALLDALVEYGHADLAYEIVSRTAFPGWVYQVEQGATTVWERWDTDQQVGSGMNSRNHSPFTLVSEFLYETLAGVRLSTALPRERRVDIAPEFVDDLDWAEASVETPQGEVVSEWERTDEGLTLHVEIPWNLSASVRLPVDAETTVRHGTDELRRSDDATRLPPRVDDVTRDGNRVVVTVASGEHDFHVV